LKEGSESELRRESDSVP